MIPAIVNISVVFTGLALNLIYKGILLKQNKRNNGQTFQSSDREWQPSQEKQLPKEDVQLEQQSLKDKQVQKNEEIQIELKNNDQRQDINIMHQEDQQLQIKTQNQNTQPSITNIQNQDQPNQKNTQNKISVKIAQNTNIQEEPQFDDEVNQQQNKISGKIAQNINIQDEPQYDEDAPQKIKQFEQVKSDNNLKSSSQLSLGPHSKGNLALVAESSQTFERSSIVTQFSIQKSPEQIITSQFYQRNEYILYISMAMFFQACISRFYVVEYQQQQARFPNLIIIALINTAICLIIYKIYQFIFNLCNFDKKFITFSLIIYNVGITFPIYWGFDDEMIYDNLSCLITCSLSLLIKLIINCCSSNNRIQNIK